MLYCPFRYGEASERTVKFEIGIWLRCSDEKRALSCVRLVSNEPLKLTFSDTTIATLSSENREYAFHTPIPCQAVYFTTFTLHGTGSVAIVERPILEEEGRDILREMCNECAFPIIVNGVLQKLVVGNGFGSIHSTNFPVNVFKPQHGICFDNPTHIQNKTLASYAASRDLLIQFSKHITDGNAVFGVDTTPYKEWAARAQSLHDQLIDHIKKQYID